MSQECLPSKRSRDSGGSYGLSMSFDMHVRDIFADRQEAASNAQGAEPLSALDVHKLQVFIHFASPLLSPEIYRQPVTGSVI